MDQEWSYVPLGIAVQTLTSEGVRLDTSAAMSTQAGYPRVLQVPLNRINGFSLLFTVQVLGEAHASQDRAGFSVLLLGEDARGIELGFWTNTIFAQSDSPLFTHAEDTNYTTTASVEYALTMQSTRYSLAANGRAILTGPVRDYSAFNGLINPYRTPNFLFFGDDTTSAAGAFLLKKAVLVTAPEVMALPDNRLTWEGVPGQTYTVASSPDLINWVVVGSARSTNSTFVFTNTFVTTPVFFRVAFL